VAPFVAPLRAELAFPPKKSSLTHFGLHLTLGLECVESLKPPRKASGYVNYGRDGASPMLDNNNIALVMERSSWMDGAIVRRQQQQWQPPCSVSLRELTILCQSFGIWVVNPCAIRSVEVHCAVQIHSSVLSIDSDNSHVGRRSNDVALLPCCSHL